MVFLYNLGIKLYNLLLFLLQFINPKAKLWVEGRKNILPLIKSRINSHDQHIWFHFASLGEFEQGRPVMEHIRSLYPSTPIIMTFFSPSGYELRKNSPLADYVFYLPLDTKNNASEFIKIINPKIVIFTKYEYWYHYFKELNRKQIPLYVISAIFRRNQPFFKWYGTLSRKTLSYVSHFFVQDESSRELLESIDLTNVTVSGDTRFDRVAENAASPKQFEIVKSFCGESRIFVAGSTWPEDEKLLAALVKEYPSWKFIIAPHEIKPEKIKSLEDMLPPRGSVRYSILSGSGLQDFDNEQKAQVLIIDNIGMLSSLYQYGEIAYIGGGFGVGIHNTLEAAAFGIPVIFGPNYQKFLEAKALISNGGGYSIKDEEALRKIMKVLKIETHRQQAGSAAGNFVQNNKGATATIVRFLQYKAS